MAGENIIEQTTKGMVSFDVTADKAYEKGDLRLEVPANDTNGPPRTRRKRGQG